MKFYQPDTRLLFGKYHGKSLLNVVAVDSDYLNWCQINLDHFYLSDEVVRQLQSTNPTFNLTSEALVRRKANYDKWLLEQDEIELGEKDLRHEKEMDSISEEMDSYDPYTDEYGNIDNDPDFNFDPHNEY